MSFELRVPRLAESISEAVVQRNVIFSGPGGAAGGAVGAAVGVGSAGA